MIRFLVTRGHAYTLEHVERAAPFGVSVSQYDRFFRKPWISGGAYVFTDIDRLSFNDLDLAADLYRQMGRYGIAVLNDPAKVKTRYALLRALHRAGINQFNAYRADERIDAIRFPVFVRKTRDHATPLSDLIHDRATLDHVVADAVARGVPLEHLIVIEYAAQPVRPGVFRKLSAFRIGDAIVPHICVHDKNWLVKYGQILGTIEDLYEEEYRLLRENPFEQTLRQSFDVAQIEYGRADFGLVDGRVQIYEINTNPLLHAPGNHPSPRRTENTRLAWQMYLDALARLDQPSVSATELADTPARRARCWKNLWYRTRPVP